MPTFGKYETGQRLFLSGVGGIYALKADDKKVIKVLQPPPGIWSDEQLRDEVDGFVLRGKTQKNLAKSSKSWAPVYEAAAIREGSEGSSGGGEAATPGGIDERNASGAYAVLDRYDRSVQSLIDGRVNLNNDDLRNVMAGTIQGLIDLKKIANRPHGNVKPSNILLANAADLAKATVHLSDPAADGALGPNAGQKDLSDLAKILYELVNLRPYQGGTIGRTKDWDELGPNGEDWRKLCNTLLDPAAPADERNLEKILPVAQTWTAKPKKSKAPILIAASIFLVLVVGGGALWFFTRPPKLDFNQPNWEKLCLSYYAWFGDFSDRMSDDNQKRKFSAAPYPAEIVKLFNDASKDLDKYQPKSIAQKPSSADDLAMHPTDEAKTGYGPYYTKMGDELVDNVTASLTPAHWPLLTQLDKTAKTYQERGWQKPAAGIRSIIEAARPPALPATPIDIEARVKLVQPVDIVGSIEKTIKASRSVDDITARWTHIQALMQQLPATDVPLLKVLPKFAEDIPRSEVDPSKPANLEDVTSLAASFTQVEKFVTQLVAEFSPKPGHEIVYAELAKDPAAQLPPNGVPTLEQYNALPAIATGYVKMNDDPRAAVTASWKTRGPQIQSDMTDYLAKAAGKIADARTHLDDLSRRQTALEGSLAAVSQVPAIEKNRQQLVKASADASDNLDKLLHDAETWSNPFKTEPAQYVKEKRDYLNTSPLAKATPVIFEQWKAAHTRFLTKVEADKEKLRSDYLYKMSVDENFANIEAAYTHIEDAIPANVPSLSNITGDDWRHAIAARVAVTKREDALTDIVAKLPFANDVPQEADPAYVSFRTQRLAGFDQIRADALALITDYSTINDRLDHLYLQANEPAPGDKTWRDLYAAWQQRKNPLLSDSVIVAALKPITDRVAALLALDNVNDYSSLVADAAAPPPAAPEISLTAWRKLGTIPISEKLPVLDDEEKVESAVTAQLNSLATEKTITSAQLNGFTREIAVQRPIRWHRWADMLVSAPAIQNALDHAAAFNVTLSAGSDPAMLYNQNLYALRKKFEENHTEAELKQIAPNFIATVKTLPASNDHDVQDLLTRMDKSLAQSQDDSSSAGAGPLLAKWEQDNSKEGIRLFYYPSKANARHTLEFVRLQVAEAGSQKTIFLCTTETPVGLFIDTINDSHKFADIDNTGKPSAQQHWFKVPARQADDIWADLGPRSWKIANKTFGLNATWLSETSPQMQGADGKMHYYPADNLKPEDPALTDPMQLLSPWSAMYAARLLGCRLPTSDEWKAAYDKYETAAALPKDTWNLRGEAPANANRLSWRMEQDYAQKMAANGMKYPDQGIFLTGDLLFAGITAQDAKPWTGTALAKIAPTRVTATADAYKGSTLWFKSAVPLANTIGTGTMHDLVGNVAEYTFDGPNAIAVIKDNAPSTAAIDAAITAGKKNLFVIGGSSLSPPDLAFNQKQPLDPDFPQTAVGYCDVGFRLAYTAPIDSIVDVLASAFKDPKYLPGP